MTVRPLCMFCKRPIAICNHDLCPPRLALKKSTGATDG